MKPPEIRIRKGATVYDDSEQEQDILRPPPPRSRRQPPKRRRRPAGRGVITPLIAVAAGIFIVFRVVPHAPASRTVLAGWQVTLHVNRLEDGLIVGVTFLRRGRQASAPPEAAARITLKGTGEQVFVAGDLDRSPMTLRGRLPDIPDAKVVQADVTIAGAHGVLVAPVPAPQAPQPAGQAPPAGQDPAPAPSPD